MWIRACTLAIWLLPSTGFADELAAPMRHEGMHAEHMKMMKPAAIVPTEPGQGAFGAIAEAVSILMADPSTDWSKVDIGALRAHLVDMDNVMLRARATSEPIEGGLRFDITGDGAVRDSIQRMVSAHSAMMDGFEGWRFESNDIDGGASLAVHAPSADAAKLKGLGFFGILTLGMHHQKHHLMIARGVGLDR